MVYHFLARTFLLPIFVFSYWRICYSQRFDHRGAKNNFLEKNAFRKVNSEVMVKPREIPASQIHTGPIILRCENHHKGFYFIRKQAYVTLQKIADFGFKPTEPYFYDVHGNRHSRPFMWVSSNNDFMCAINLKGMIISIKGAIFNGKDGVAVMWHHPSILGTHETAYYRNPDLLIGFGKAEREYLGDPKPNDTYNFIVPIRTRWDYCFHHFHIQTIPLIAAIYEFHQNEWEKITWHTSLHSAGVLSLMGVPLERMVIDTPIKAKRVLLPWYPNWNPLEVAAFKGITRRTCQLITEKVLEKHIDPTVLAKTYKIVVSIINPLLNNTYSAMAARGGDGNLQELLQTNDRLVIYFSRPPPKRAVVNEQELFAAIASSLLPGYRFLVIQSIPYVHNETIDMMHALWQQFARVVSRAKVLIGPHGSGLTNMIWAPEDCHLIEFNEIATSDEWDNTPYKVPARSMVFAGFWMRTGTGEMWIVEAGRKSHKSFYEGSIQIVVREVLEVLNKLKLVTLDAVARFPNEMHGFWPIAEEGSK